MNFGTHTNGEKLRVNYWKIDYKRMAQRTSLNRKKMAKKSFISGTNNMTIYVQEIGNFIINKER